MTGKPRRGLADFLSRELKTQVVTPEPKAEVRQSESDRVTVVAPVKVVPEVAKVESDRVTATAPAKAAPEVAKVESDRVANSVVEKVAEEKPEVRKPESHEVRKSESHEVRESLPEVPRASKPEPVKAPAVTKVQSDRVRDEDVEDEGSDDEPLYLRLTRKEVRFRDDQLGALHAVTRRLSKARRGAKGDRITENTLVRVAVDLLLLHGDDLSGHDEATLLDSLRRLCRKKS